MIFTLEFAKKIGFNLKSCSRYWIFLILFSLVIHGGQLFGQSPVFYEYAHYTSNNGLPQNQIAGIVEDPNHFIWFGTQNGLCRFDGKRFLNIDKTSFPGLLSNRIMGVIGSKNKVLFNTGYDLNQWFSVKENSNEVEKLEKNETDFWLVNTNTRINLTKLFSQFDLKTAKNLGFQLQKKSNNKFKLVDGSQEENGYFTFENILFHYQSGKLLKMGALNDYSAVFMLENKLFILTNSGNLMQIDDLGVRNIFNIQSKKGIIQNNRMLVKMSAINFSNGAMFLQLENKLYKVEIQNGAFKFVLFANLLENLSIIHVLFLPKSDILFLGTINNGLFVFKQTHFLNFRSTNEGKGEIKWHNVFYACVPYLNNSILTSHGIFDSIGNFKDHELTPNPFVLVKGKENEIYFFADNKLCVSKNIEFPGQILSTLKGKEFWLDIHPSGKLFWSEGSGIKSRDVDGKVESLLLLSKRSGSIQMFKCISENVIWISTSNGFLEYNLQTKQLSRFAQFNGIQVQSIYKDKYGNCWIGTYGDGWLLYRNHKFETLPLDPLRYLKIVNGFVEDNNGYLWVSTNNGFFRFKMDMFKTGSKELPFYNHYNSSYGFASDESNGGCTPSAFRTVKGRLGFPTLKGVVLVDPFKINTEETNANIFIDFVTADNRVLSKNLPYRIEGGTEEIIITCSSPFYGNPYNLNLQYRFVGSESAWISLPPSGKIRLVKMTHGNYTIVIRKPSGFSSMGYVKKSINFVVLPYWYQTRWFIILLLGLSILITWLFIQYRIRFLKLQKRELEKRVEQSTYEISNQNFELKQSILEIIKSKDALSASNLLNERLMASLAHDIRSPLKFQLTAAEIMVNIIGTNENPDLIRIAKEIKQNTAGMYNFTGDILAWHLLISEGKKMEKETTNLKNVVDDCISFLQFSAAMNYNTFVNNIDFESVIETIKPIAEIAIRNLMDNGNKNTRNGTVTLEMVKDETSWRILITDNGIGMRSQEVSAINEFYRNSKDSAMPGFGSYMLRDFIVLLNAEILYHSIEGVGTTVTLRCFTSR